MSASATIASQAPYKDQVKLIRAEAFVSWFAVAFDRAIEALKIEPAAVVADEESAKPRGWFGTFY